MGNVPNQDPERHTPHRKPAKTPKPKTPNPTVVWGQWGVAFWSLVREPLGWHRIQRVLLLEREFFIDNLLVRIYFIIVMIGWTGLAPWEFESPFPDSLRSTLLSLPLLSVTEVPFRVDMLHSGRLPSRAALSTSKHTLRQIPS